MASPRPHSPEDDPLYLTRQALYLFVKCFMQTAPHGQKFKEFFESLSNKEREVAIFKFVSKSQEPYPCGIAAGINIDRSPPGKSGLPAVYFLPWGGRVRQGYSWNELLVELMAVNKVENPGVLQYSRQSSKYSYQWPIPISSNLIDYLWSCFRIASENILKLTPWLNSLLFYEKDYVPAHKASQYDPLVKAELDQFFESDRVKSREMCLPDPLRRLIAALAFDVAAEIEDFLNSKMDASGDCNLSSIDFYEIEKILHPNLESRLAIKKPEEVKEVSNSPGEMAAASGVSAGLGAGAGAGAGAASVHQHSIAKVKDMGSILDEIFLELSEIADYLNSQKNTDVKWQVIREGENPVLHAETMQKKQNPILSLFQGSKGAKILPLALGDDSLHQRIAVELQKNKQKIRDPELMKEMIKAVRSIKGLRM